MDAVRPYNLPERFAYSVSLDRSYYNRTHEIYEWLGQHMGSSLSWSVDGVYSVDQVFGYTTVYFVKDSDRAQFSLAWI
jgi:hypothetical protein